jgi:hypothetical protein
VNQAQVPRRLLRAAAVLRRRSRRLLCSLGQLGQGNSEVRSVAEGSGKLNALAAQVMGLGLVTGVERQQTLNNQSGDAGLYRSIHPGRQISVGGSPPDVRLTSRRQKRDQIPASAREVWQHRGEGQ